MAKDWLCAAGWGSGRLPSRSPARRSAAGSTTTRSGRHARPWPTWPRALWTALRWPLQPISDVEYIDHMAALTDVVDRVSKQLNSGELGSETPVPGVTQVKADPPASDSVLRLIGDDRRPAREPGPAVFPRVHSPAGRSLLGVLSPPRRWVCSRRRPSCLRCGWSRFWARATPSEEHPVPASSPVRSDRDDRFDTVGDPLGASLPLHVLDRARADPRATQVPIDVPYFDGLADAIRQLASERGTGPAALDGQVVKLRHVCSLLIREPPRELTQPNRDAVVRIARTAAAELDTIRGKLESGGDPSALREQFTGAVNSMLKDVHERREAAIPSSR